MSPRLPPPDRDLVERREILNESGITRALQRMAFELIERSAAPEEGIYLVGIRTGGAHLANRLATLVRLQAPGTNVTVGAIDISLYRDDVFLGLPKPEIGPTELPVGVDGVTVVLVDDVLYTGRTIRAAMNELFDYGRPRSIRLAALIDRGGRQLPIAAQFVGAQVSVADADQIELKKNEEDRLSLALTRQGAA